MASRFWPRKATFTVLPLLALTSAANLGSWTPLINFPVTPAAVFIAPKYPVSDTLLAFSSFNDTLFRDNDEGPTQFAEYTISSGAVSHRTVANTNHDMFCPGSSALANGSLVITGGSSSYKTTIYNPSTDSFTSGPDMKIARGYQSTVTIADGRIFTIGGSWSGGRGGKNGEIYDPKTNAWTKLPSATVSSILTADAGGIFRQDNHAWLYAWTNNSVFQAGPSKAMNWFDINKNGSVTAAGTRDATNDAMCGVTVMYEPGKIFSAGGSPDYESANAIATAHLISIGTPYTAATVIQLPDMHFARIFHNAVVLPNGQIIIMGGQSWGDPFTDSNATLVVELFDPATKVFTKLASAAVARNYHSTGILLPDGTVFNGGGGLCYSGVRVCNNHEDGQIFTPPYLFNSTGGPAARPVITSVGGVASTSSSPVAFKPGQNSTVSVSGNATGVSFVLVRVGSSTHTVNTDQRRVPLTVANVTGSNATIIVPKDYGIVIPGAYYLFALSSAQVPSISRTVFIQ